MIRKPLECECCVRGIAVQFHAMQKLPGPQVQRMRTKVESTSSQEPYEGTLCKRSSQDFWRCAFSWWWLRSATCTADVRNDVSQGSALNMETRMNCVVNWGASFASLGTPTLHMDPIYIPRCSARCCTTTLSPQLLELHSRTAGST